MRLRKKAAEEGLDSNKWFGNVKLEVARDIGQESVTYVSNIYKYYIAYKLGGEQAHTWEKAKATAGQTKSAPTKSLTPAGLFLSTNHYPLYWLSASASVSGVTGRQVLSGLIAVIALAWSAVWAPRSF